MPYGNAADYFTVAVFVKRYFQVVINYVSAVFSLAVAGAAEYRRVGKRKYTVLPVKRDGRGINVLPVVNGDLTRIGLVKHVFQRIRFRRGAAGGEQRKYKY